MKKLLLAAMLGATMLGGPAYAQADPQAGAMPPPPPGGPMRGDPLARLDTNGDGIISKDEYLVSIDRQFDMLDTDHDGKITQAEIQARQQAMEARRAARADGQTPPPPPPGGGGGGMGMGGRMLMRADANGDGMVTRDEFRTAAMVRFTAMDTNKDGKIDQAERDAIRARMDRYRGNAEGPQPGQVPPPPPAGN